MCTARVRATYDLMRAKMKQFLLTTVRPLALVSHDECGVQVMNKDGCITPQHLESYKKNCGIIEVRVVSLV